MRLAEDKTAQEIMKAWERQPWCDAHRCALADRARDLGLPIAELIASETMLPENLEIRHLPRRARQGLTLCVAYHIGGSPGQ